MKFFDLFGCWAWFLGLGSFDAREWSTECLLWLPLLDVLGKESWFSGD
jgi:hypothetical protein